MATISCPSVTNGPSCLYWSNKLGPSQRNITTSLSMLVAGSYINLATISIVTGACGGGLGTILKIAVASGIRYPTGVADGLLCHPRRVAAARIANSKQLHDFMIGAFQLRLDFLLGDPPVAAAMRSIAGRAELFWTNGTRPRRLRASAPSLPPVFRIEHALPPFARRGEWLQYPGVGLDPATHVFSTSFFAARKMWTPTDQVREQKAHGSSPAEGIIRLKSARRRLRLLLLGQDVGAQAFRRSDVIRGVALAIDLKRAVYGRKRLP